MITVRKGTERGHSHTDWLESRHTFSFADYSDPSHMGFGRLRVLNEDIVAPGRGFGRHPHRDMEILSYVLEGALEHGDSMGNGSIIRPGDVQRMSAGTGVIHSERNASAADRVHFLQIWIEPDTRGIPPGYEEKRFTNEQKHNALRLVASRDGRDGTVTVHQDVNLYAAVLDPGAKVTLTLSSGRRAWVQVARGAASVDGLALAQGDGTAIEKASSISIEGESPETEVLVFDLA
jgi:hypothetical protein